MKLLITIFIIFLGCNPLMVIDYATGSTTDIELYICAGPTRHYQVKVPDEHISIDKLEKYFYIDLENGMYRQRMDRLIIENRKGDISCYFRGYSKKAEVYFEEREEFYIPMCDVEDLDMDSVLVFLRVL